VDIINRRLGYEGHRGKYKRSERTCALGSRNDGSTTTSGAHDNHFGSMVGICRSGENEGSKKCPAKRLGSLQDGAVRVIVELSIVHGKVKKATIEEYKKLTHLTMQGAEDIATT
jgi:hypothetical protein